MARSILQRLHRSDHFESAAEVERFESRLAEWLGKGIVEEIPVQMAETEMRDERWIRDPRTEKVFRYVAPDFPMRGTWAEVEHPAMRSYFRALERRYGIPEADYPALLEKLDQAVRRGEIERGYDMEAGYTKPGVRGIQYYFHEPTEECFELIPPIAPFHEALWSAMRASKKDGTWPGRLKIG